MYLTISALFFPVKTVKRFDANFVTFLNLIAITSVGRTEGDKEVRTYVKLPFLRKLDGFPA
jgi:hypothetical protein